MSNCTPGMTPAAIKYLLVLDDLCREGKGVRSVEIAARMNVSKPSAHSMLQNLCQAGLVEKERYGTVYLTRAGRSAAADYAACFGPLCRRMQEALGLEEDACQTAAYAILAQSQDRLPQLRDRLRAAE